MHPLFIPVLFPIAKMWKQPTCPLTDEWIKKMWYIYVYMEYYSAYSAIKKKERNLAICDNMDGPRGYYAKWNTDRERQNCMILLTCYIYKNKRNEQI